MTSSLRLHQRLRRVLQPTLLAVGTSLAIGIAGCKGTSANAKAAPDRPESLNGTSVASGGATSPSDTLTDAELTTRADAGRLMGRDSGAMWLIVISDFQCPYCKMWHDSTHAAVKRDYVDKGLVRLGYLNLPLPQHTHARNEAEASLCAGAQGQFWPFAEVLFREQDAIGRMTTIEPLFDSVGKALAIDMKEFARCRKSHTIRALVDSDVQQALRARVNSTPSFLVGEFLVQGVSPYANFRKAIDTALVVARNKAKGTR